jgi:polyhydroxybutyrate depolymerase
MKKLYILCISLFLLSFFTMGKAQILVVNDTERSYTVHVPEDLPENTDVPLIIALHPLGSTNTQFESTTGFSVKADQEGFIVAYPQGIGNSWNAGACCDPALNQEVDDIGFISMLIDTLIGNYPVDTNCVFLTGFSNGAIMAYALASEISEKLDGVAAVGGLLTLENHAGHAMPVMHIHALYDASVSINGQWGFPSVYSLLDEWKSLNGIVAEADTFRDDNGVKGILYPSPDEKSNIILYTAETGIHGWTIDPRLGTTNCIWEFFSTGRNSVPLTQDTIIEGPRKRDYMLSVPDSWFTTVENQVKFPLVIAAHGWDQTPQDMEEMTRLSTLGNIKGFFVAYLHYVGPPPDTSWNYYMEAGKPDDIGYAKAVIDTLFARFPIDSARVFAAGFSDGCGLVNRLAFETDGLINATGTVAGMLTFEAEVVTTPVRMIHFHARNDPYVSYSTIRNTNLAYWLDANGCDTDADTVLNIEGYIAELFTNAEGDSSVLFYTLPWAQHNWPVNGQNSMKLSASNLMWNFFSTGMAIANIATEPESVSTHRNDDVLRVYPNPARELLQVDLNLASAQAVSMRLIQLDGKVVHSEIKNASAGKQEISLDLREFSPGIYTLSVRGNTLNRAIPIVID